MVSCLCPTFNRPPVHGWLVEEAIESFLRQDYLEKELILLNDCPTQELTCELPGVVVVNVPRRFRSLGEKLNAAAGFSRGELIAPWDDDDISLPWRLSQSVGALGESDYYNPSRYWYADHRGLHRDHAMGVAHACSMFTRRAFDVVGGYEHQSGDFDLVMDERLRSHPDLNMANGVELEPSDWYYVYRWGVSPVHLSGRGPDEGWYEKVGTQPVEAGTYRLQPHWRGDYVLATRMLLDQAS
jgi:glycosyltransferase involved in cell wall biosynthesis